MLVQCLIFSLGQPLLHLPCPFTLQAVEHVFFFFQLGVELSDNGLHVCSLLVFEALVLRPDGVEEASQFTVKQGVTLLKGGVWVK